MNAQLTGERIPLTEKLTSAQLLEADLYVQARAHVEMKRRAGLAGRLHRRDADLALSNALARYGKGAAQ